MSELLYLFGEIDERVRPLTFCVRKWATAVGLTNPSPGRWISNFSLTMLVLFFLQQLKKPILPPINHLIKSATDEDRRVTDDGINCTFLRDLNRLEFDSSSNSEALGYLLIQFFEFYSQFDFKNRGISLNDGKMIPKPDHSAMYIVNPLETHLNVSKNLSLEETERFKLEVRNAAWILESAYDKSKAENLESWGLLPLFKTNKEAIIKPQMFFKPRMFDVSDLFDGSSENNEIEFKNQNLKTQIEGYRKQTRHEINKLHANKRRR
jgi:poly(A) RNA polymerase